MNNPLPASCCLVPARALPAASRTALAGAASVLPERFLFFPQTDGGTWLGRIGQQILYLQFSSNASLQLQCLHQRDILCLYCAKKLLIEDCCVYYRSNSTVQCLTLPLSQMRHELVTLLLLALLQPQGQPTTAVLPMPSAFGELQELCSYAPAAAVFGRQIGNWNWWRIDENGFPFRKKGHGSAALYCEMEHGSIVVARRNTEVATWYLPSGRSCLLSCLEHGTMTLCIRTGQQVLGEIPHLKAESMVSA